MDEKKRKRFAPLQKHEDWQRAFWYFIGACTTFLFQILKLIFQ